MGQYISGIVLGVVFGAVHELKVLFFMVVEYLFWLSDCLELVQIDFVVGLGGFLHSFADLFFLGVRNHFFAIGVYRVVASVYLLLQTVVETCFPDVDHFVGTAGDEVVSLSAEFGCVGV